MTALWLLALPELREFELARRPEALRSARDTPLDFLELVSMALGMVVVTALTRRGLPADALASSRAFGLVLNFAVALPLLAIFLGPFHIRRLRRGLRTQLRKRAPR